MSSIVPAITLAEPLGVTFGIIFDSFDNCPSVEFLTCNVDNFHGIEFTVKVQQKCIKLNSKV